MFPTALLFLAFLGCAPACSPSKTSDRAENRRDEAAERLDKLRSLGYAGFVPREQDVPGSGVTLSRPGVTPGLRFFTSPTLCKSLLIDAAGQVLRSWGSPCHRWANGELLATGDVLITGTDPSREGAASEPEPFLMRLDWSGKPRWKRPYPSHHDTRLLPDGDILTLVERRRRLPDIHPSAPVRDNAIAVLSSEGLEKGQLSLYDLLKSHRGGALLRRGKPGPKGDVDLFHANSVQWLPPASVLVSIRHQDLVALVSWETARVTWAWGQDVLSAPHDATMLPNGRVLVFDNGLGRGWSRVIEVGTSTNKIEWEYRGTPPTAFYTATRGAAQRLANGNTLIVESDKGRAFEVNPSGATVWEYRNPLRNEKGERAAIMRMRVVDEATFAALLSNSHP